jgi:hypothetical protein
MTFQPDTGEPVSTARNPDAPANGAVGTAVSGSYDSSRPSVTPIHADRPSRWRKNTKFFLETFGVLLLFAYTCFSCLQWLQIRYTNALTDRALTGSNKSMQDTLQKMQAQTDATTHLYVEAQKQTSQSTIMAKNSGIEAAANLRGANAAKSAAEFAGEGLHVGERAYVIAVLDQVNDNFMQQCPLGRTTQHYCTRVTFKNIGKTPALGVVLSGTLAFHSMSLTSQQIAPAYAGTNGRIIAVGESESTPVLTLGNGLSDQSDYMVAKQVKFGYMVYGFIQYKDIFNETHVTSFCNHYPFERGPDIAPETCGGWIDKPARQPK